MYVYKYDLKASIQKGVVQGYDLKKRCEAVKNIRNITKEDMVLNNYLPNISGVYYDIYEFYLPHNITCLLKILSVN